MQVSVSKATAVFIYSFLIVGVILAAVGSCSNLHIHARFDLYWKGEGCVVAVKAGDASLKCWWGCLLCTKHFQQAALSLNTGFQRLFDAFLHSSAR